MLLCNPNDNITLSQLRKLRERANANLTSLGDIFQDMMLKKGLKHKCVKCKGEGYVPKSINTYPSGLPDSGWVVQYETVFVACDLCNGEGYTADQYEEQVVKVEYIKKH